MIKEKFYIDYLKTKKRLNRFLKKEMESLTKSKRFLINTSYNNEKKQIEIVVDFYAPNLKMFVKTDVLSFDVGEPIENIIEKIREEIFYGNAEAFL